MPQTANETEIADATIEPSRIVKRDTTGHRVIQSAAATDFHFGISTEAQKDPPGLTSNTYAAVQGDPIRVYREPKRALLQIGSGGCTAGDKLTADSVGKGITTTTAGNTFIGFAVRDGAEDEFIPVDIAPGIIHA